MEAPRPKAGGAAPGKGKAGAGGGAALKNPRLVNAVVPAEWLETRDYVRQGPLQPGDLVILSRSDGSTRFGEVLRKAGFPWQVPLPPLPPLPPAYPPVTPGFSPRPRASAPGGCFPLGAR